MGPQGDRGDAAVRPRRPVPLLGRRAAAGGGGIGFLLQQNINLVHYRDASVQMVAIAITVASMDYISSVMRERFV